jgi:protein TonB
MFENALLESSGAKPRGASLWTKGMSFAFELMLLSLAVLVPLLYTEALPRHVLSGILEAPAPPPAAPAPRTLPVATRSQMHSELNGDRILLPVAIPEHVKEIHDESAVNSAPTGDPGAVVGAPPNDTANRTIATLLETLPPAMPKSVTPHAVRVSSGVAQGLLIHQVRPQYPALARSARIQGSVVLQATIGKDGAIQNLHLLSGHPLLTQAAMEAVRQWRYRPYLLNNEPVEVDTTIQVNFTLNGAN